MFGVRNYILLQKSSNLLLHTSDISVILNESYLNLRILMEIAFFETFALIVFERPFRAPVEISDVKF